MEGGRRERGFNKKGEESYLFILSFNHSSALSRSILHNISTSHFLPQPSSSSSSSFSHSTRHNHIHTIHPPFSLFKTSSSTSFNLSPISLDSLCFTIIIDTFTQSHLHQAFNTS